MWRRIWHRIKHPFTRQHRDVNEPPHVHYVRWYSPTSCQWSKWRPIPRDWVSSDHTLIRKLAGSQRFELTNVLPEGAEVRTKGLPWQP